MVVIETELLTFYEWLLNSEEPALWVFVQIVAALALAALIVGYLVAAVRHGPLKGGDLTYRVAMNGLRELPALSPRRVWALTTLAVKEAMRRRAWVAVLVYVVLLLFAGWFLDTKRVDDPLKLYVSFVMTASTFLVLLLALFVSAFSLPSDIKNRIIYTIVTKPVYAGEIVLGRILGFSLLGTGLLAVMGLISYFFVVRALQHTHTLSPHDLVAASTDSGAATGEMAGQTSLANHHRHAVTVRADGHVEVDAARGHWHEVTAEQVGGQTVYKVSGPRGLFQARVPVHGKLRFKDRTGQDVDRGISVGNEWSYRQYIEGETQAAAIWTFDNVREEVYGDYLPLEVYIRVFRSYQGEIGKGILGGIVLKNPHPDKDVQSAVRTFSAKDFSIDQQYFPRKLEDSHGNEIDLYEDLVHDGKLEVWIQCLHRSQYFGMAQADVYLRARDGSFDFNFLKGYLSVWTQMVVVICFGVMFSTFLSGPVAMIATLGSIVLGFYQEFIVDLAAGRVYGGGPLESLIRLPTQMNLTAELDDSLGVTIAQTLDQMILFCMHHFVSLLPDFSRYSHDEWVATGFDVPFDLTAQNLVKAVSYVLAAFVAGYFFLRTREVAR